MGQIEALGKLRLSWLRIACNGQDGESLGKEQGRLAGAQPQPAALAVAELLIQRQPQPQLDRRLTRMAELHLK